MKVLLLIIVEVIWQMVAGLLMSSGSDHQTPGVT